MNNMKKIIILIVLIILVSVLGYFSYQKFWKNTFFNKLPKLQDISQRISTPDPLSGPQRESCAESLEPNKIIEFTNQNRKSENLVRLAKNEKLTETAEAKIIDMFTNQYFEHVSPIDQKDVTFFTGETGYNYILVGENLALGDFENEQELVDGWMASPGHRENIMNKNYTQIGVAAKKGNFDDRDTWLAVQIFGKPSSDCSSPLASLKLEIEQKQKEYEKIDELNNQVKILQDEGKSLIEQGNTKIEKGNKIYEETHDKSQAQPYWDDGKSLQNQGNAKYDEANKIIDQINNLIRLYDEISSLIEKYNKQVDEYNKCLGS